MDVILKWGLVCVFECYWETPPLGQSSVDNENIKRVKIVY